MPGLKFWKKKEKTEERPKKKEERTCTCEICRFSAKLDEKIPDKLVREIVSPFVIFPSTIKDTDPRKKLEEAKELEKKGEVSSAANSYRVAAISALFKKVDYDKFWAEYSDFLSKANLSRYSDDIRVYGELKQRKDVMEILINTYEEFIHAEVEKKKT